MGDCQYINDRIIKSEQVHEIGKRVHRTFGLIVDTGSMDKEVGKYIDKCLNNLRENLQQLRTKQNVVRGRGNLILLIREINRTFGYSDWTPSHKVEFNRVRNEFEQILEEIQEVEKEQIGHALPGTTRDFNLIRSIMTGIENNQDEKEKAIASTSDFVLKEIQNQSISADGVVQNLKPIRSLLGEDKLSELVDAVNSCSRFTSEEKKRLLKFFRASDRLKIRILGMPQSTFPYAMNADWRESLGQLNADKHSAEVGSIVRFDLKANYRKGSMKPIISNISYASDEWDIAGELKTKFLKEEQEIQWPEPLPESTWLMLGTTADSIMGRRSPPKRYTNVHQKG